ncbi:MAG: PadR family transcriptional regulator [Candidatus Heimdallarchaeota archaeon]|nr:PadR family transcriptional regulator [Candidatus Heimdallarchaeota archaeon]MDH5645111.1 PadR family transcriptional regulator [Candidatus Heimdallarchaeota archaeon]
MSPPKDKNEIYKPVERLWKKLRVENLWLWILKLLKEDNKYAYELRDQVKERFGFEPATVTSYAVLYRLEKSGFVREANTSFTPNRKYYEITDLGIQALTQAETIIRKTTDELFGNKN